MGNFTDIDESTSDSSSVGNMTWISNLPRSSKWEEGLGSGSVGLGPG